MSEISATKMAYKIRENERVKKLYRENPEHREKVKQRALARYYRIKQDKIDKMIAAGIDPYD